MERRQNPGSEVEPLNRSRIALRSIRGGPCGRPAGHHGRPLGVEHFSQTGSIADLYRHYAIDANVIIAAAEAIAPGRPIRYLGVV